MKRLIARFARETSNHFEIITVYDKSTEIEKLDKVNPISGTFTHHHPSAIWFERKMKDDFGIRFEGSFDERPLLHQEEFPQDIHPMRKDFLDKKISYVDAVAYPYEAIGGDGVFQVSVGPIHAGIIEPGHFQFSQAGEEILHLEVRHFYAYRAIEKMLEGKTLDEAKPIIERISGGESIAYQIAWRDLILGMGDNTMGDKMYAYHAFLLELERVIHHLSDIGFIPNDAGFGAALAYASRLTENARRVMRRLTGHRFGFAGVNFEDGFAEKSEDNKFLSDWLNKLSREVSWFEEWINNTPSVLDRFDTAGIFSTKNAIKYDTVGIVARASGLKTDVRLGDKFYEDHGFVLQTGKSGDVTARFKLRIAEIYNSISMMHSFLKVEDNTQAKIDNMIDGTYHSFCESSIGELFMYVDIKNGKIERFYARDPSFVNWQGVHMMMPGNIIADFPLINKSCDLSYAGNDL